MKRKGRPDAPYFLFLVSHIKFADELPSDGGPRRASLCTFDRIGSPASSLRSHRRTGERTEHKERLRPDDRKDDQRSGRDRQGYAFEFPYHCCVRVWGCVVLSNESESIGARASNFETAKIRSEKFRVARRRKFFRVVAKHAFPSKTVPAVRALTGYPERTIYDWLAGNSDAPSGVLLQLFGEIGRQ